VAKTDNPADKMRKYISQGDVPSVSLEKAIRIPAAIGDNYGFRPASPLQVAKALEVQPTNGGFKMLTGAAIAYGLTAGGYNAETISITPLGMRIVRPTTEGDDFAAKREAVLRPRVIREFLQKYDGASIPKESIGYNVLMDMGVPQARAPEVFKLIVESAESVSFLQTIKDRKYVDLSNTNIPSESMAGEEASSERASTSILVPDVPEPAAPKTSSGSQPPADARSRKVFITHGKNKALIEPIKKLLVFGELEAVVSVQTQTVSQPVPGKVMEEMRSCGAAIIHVEDERRLADKDGNAHIVLNDNVLIEIGAALALYGQRFILVVKEGVKLPSNLLGLLELRYKGETLDMEETIKLLEAINDMKMRPLPAAYSGQELK
jgi:predicted nucleotide-binding protein